MDRPHTHHFGTLRRAVFCISAWLFLVPALALAQGDWTRPIPERYEERAKSMEADAIENVVPEKAVLFVGSATIAGWDLEQWFPEFNTVKRGWGGSMIHEATHFTDRLILPHKPSTIVMYSGDNDIWLGKSPELTARHFGEFVAKIHASLPGTQIIFISIRPSIARWKVVEKYREANRLIKAMTERDDRLHYADIDAPMIGADGKPRPQLFVRDNLHLSGAGFKLWAMVVTPVIERAEANFRKLSDEG